MSARLIGQRVRVLVHHDHLEVYFGERLVERRTRLRGREPAWIDCRHVIWSLAKKPGAFARYRWRDELFPTLIFRRSFDALRSFCAERADPEYVGIRYMAATSGEASFLLTLTTTTEPALISRSAGIAQILVRRNDPRWARSLPSRRLAGCTIATNASRPEVA